MKNFLQIALLALVALGVGQWAFEKVDRPQFDATSDSGGEVASEVHPDGIVVTYFTTDVRCKSCLTIESLTRAAMEEGFAEELALGDVRFETRNLDRPQNATYARSYELAFKTVVIAEWRDGKQLRWQRMDDVWSLFDDPSTFKSYLARQVTDYLETRA